MLPIPCSARLVRAAAVLALACAVGAADRPWVTVAVGDGQRLIERWNASIYAKLWAHDALADARAKFAEGEAAAEKEIGFAPFALLADCRGVDARFLGMSDPKHPQLAVQAVFGSRAPELFAKIKAALAAQGAQKVELADETVETADEALRLTDPKDAQNHAVLARFAGTLVLALNPPRPPAPLPPSVDDADVMVTVDAEAIRGDLKAAQDPNLAKTDVDNLLRLYGGDAVHRLWIEPDGMRTRSEQKGLVGLLEPAERALFARLPAATTVYAGMFGVDGKQLWASARTGVLPLMSRLFNAADADEVEARIDDQLSSAGIPVRVSELAEGLVGTCLFAISNAAPVGVTVAVPRSAPLDRLIETVLRNNHLKIPAEGQSAPVAPPGLPLNMMLARDLGHWLLTSDLGMASAWTRAQSSGWADNPAGRLAISKAPPDATVIAGLDLPQAIRMATPWIGMAMSNADAPSERKQQVTQFLSDFADQAKPEYTASWAQDGTEVSEYHGTIGGLTGIYFGAIAAFALPQMLESRVGANEAATAATLKSGIFPAEVQFQAGGYCDEDGDSIGEYGFLDELAGTRDVGTTKAGSLHLLMGPVAATGEANGYRFAMHLPDGAGELAEPAQPRAGGAKPGDANVDARERFFVVYAWPSDDSSGKRVFALDQTGQVYAAPADGKEPAWNALYGDKGTWGGTAVWPLYRR